MKTKLVGKHSIPEIIAEMSLTEKLQLLTGETFFKSKAFEEYGIPSALFLDGGTGFNSMQMTMEIATQTAREMAPVVPLEEYTDDVMGMNDFSAMTLLAQMGNMEGMSEEDQKKAGMIGMRLTQEMPDTSKLGCYPPGMLLGATWNPDAVYQCGEALGRESVACGIDVLLGTPNVNLHRDPRNGRLFEGYSEDPHLISELAPAFVKGIQETGTIANVKHFAANNQETDRMGVNELIQERALRELYLPGFRACVQEGGCKTLMSAYNAINGTPCAQNPFLLKKILRGEWGFEGFVVSDWGAVYDRVEALAAGNDLTMPGPRSIAMLIEAVEDGRISMESVDQSVQHYLSVLLEMPVMKGRKYTQIDPVHSMKGAYLAAVEGITLLKNNGVLPLSKDSNVSFYGAHSKDLITSGGGSAEVKTDCNTNPFDCTVTKLGENNVLFEEITDKTDAVIVTVSAFGSEGSDRNSMSLSAADADLMRNAIKAAKGKGKPVIALLNVVGPVELTEFVDDLDAVLCLYFPGMAGGQATADILFGDANPSGKLPLTFPKYYRDCPTFGNFPGENKEVMYGEGIYVGYRYYDKKQVEPLFPFGFGLTYTSFEFSDLAVPEIADLSTNEFVSVSVKIKNTGKRHGKEVVQLYLKDEQSTLERPEKELKAFAKVALAPGEEKTVEFKLPSGAFSYYDVSQSSWVIEPGWFNVMVGNSSRDIALSAAMKLRCASSYAFRPDMTIKKIISEPKWMELLVKDIPSPDFAMTISLLAYNTPQMTFAEFWDTNVVGTLAGSEEEKAAIYAHILADFDKLSYGE